MCRENLLHGAHQVSIWAYHWQDGNENTESEDGIPLLTAAIQVTHESHFVEIRVQSAKVGTNQGNILVQGG